MREAVLKEEISDEAVLPGRQLKEEKIRPGSASSYFVSLMIAQPSKRRETTIWLSDFFRSRSFFLMGGVSYFYFVWPPMKERNKRSAPKAGTEEMTGLISFLSLSGPVIISSSVPSIQGLLERRPRFLSSGLVFFFRWPDGIVDQVKERFHPPVVSHMKDNNLADDPPFLT